MAAQFILALQTIVSREDSPLDPAVVTVGSIHGGTKRNIIPDEVQLLLTVRTYKPEVRKRVLASIERIAQRRRHRRRRAGRPHADDRGADRRVDRVDLQRSRADGAPGQGARRVMGEKNVVKIDPLMVSEDFGRFALDGKIPATMLNVGAVDPARIASRRDACRRCIRRSSRRCRNRRCAAP